MPPKYLFTDLGGVLLTNGWDHSSRELAAEHFGLDIHELQRRHEAVFPNYEQGFNTLEEYLQFAVFHEQRDFTPAEFIDFMKKQSQPYPEMIEYVKALKLKNNIKVVAVSNEGRELAQHRIDTYELDSFIDIFIVSAFVGRRKPYEDIYRLALEVAGAVKSEVVYLDDRQMLAQGAQAFGLDAIWHRNLDATRQELTERGLVG
jgi:putative hydrolase of the HAD superfamily